MITFMPVLLLLLLLLLMLLCCSRLFEDYDDWGSTVQGRPGRFRSTTCSLTTVLNARLLQVSWVMTATHMLTE